MPDRFVRRFTTRSPRVCPRRSGRLLRSDTPAPPTPLTPPGLRSETPDADGVRRNLVRHYQSLIAANALDTPARLTAAERRLYDLLADPG